MNFEEKIAVFENEVRRRGYEVSKHLPPLYKILWGCGIQTPPPVFCSFGMNLLIHGFATGLLWGVGMWIIRGGGHFVWHSAISSLFGLLMGIAFAVWYEILKRKCQFGFWGNYPHENS